ncbi:hypothetical protein FAF44_06875, partial [Nonomuraea sp. MG754425]|nr:hypothetical protein [Nonomuraea sp. MG754425]
MDHSRAGLLGCLVCPAQRHQDASHRSSGGCFAPLPPPLAAGLRHGRSRQPDHRVTVDDDAVVVTAVKLADDGSGDVIVRFHESRGG